MQNLYHYTSRYQVEQIIESGYLKLTPSNLIKPVDLKIMKLTDGNYDAVSAISDPIKPVVWLTSSLDTSGHGIESPHDPNFKKRIRITIPTKDSYKWWITWAEENRMNKSWFKAFTRGKRYGTWYVSEEAIMLDDVLLIEDLVTGEVLYDNRQSKQMSA